ncbi:MAG: hypothetical protein N7Q72_05515 [Spiroplasma sp. Tabriz.8]|nr:hypothetical protein [Spiroplasma sp. Tabriz.8]
MFPYWIQTIIYLSNLITIIFQHKYIYIYIYIYINIIYLVVYINYYKLYK